MKISKNLKITSIFGGGITVLATVLSISTPANAVITFSTSSQTSWEAEVGNNFSVETFDSVTSDTRFDSEQTVGDLTLEGRDGSTNQLVIDAQPVQVSAWDFNGTTQLRGRTELGGSGDDDYFTIDFAQPITAFGASFYDISDGSADTQIDVGMATTGSSDPIDDIIISGTISVPDSGNDTESFFGFISDEEFTRVRFTSNNGADGFAVDDVVSSSVPFEFSPSLGLFAIGGIWGVSRLRKRVSVSKITK